MTVVTVPIVGKYGVIKDQPPQELPMGAWSDAINIRFREQGAERFLGQRQLFDASPVVPVWIQQYNQGGKRWWVHAGVNAVYADDGTSRSTITPTVAPTGTMGNRWTGGVLNGVLVANNGVDNPWYWGGAGVLEPLPNWPAGVQVASLRPYKNVLVGLDVTKSGTRYAHMVKWSHVADPGAVPDTWDETDLTKLAGEIELGEEPSLLVDQAVLGDVNVIYKEQSMWAMSPTGGQDVFRFQRLPGNVGALARGCIGSTPVGHVVLTPGDVILHNGQGPKSIITAIARRWLFNAIDSTNRSRSFVAVNPRYNEVWVCFPDLGEDSCTTAMVWNWTTNTWAIRELPRITHAASGQIDYSIISTWDGQTETWADMVTAWNQDELSPAESLMLSTGLNQHITGIDMTGTFDGVPYKSQMERQGMSFDAPDKVKLVRSIYPRVEASAGTRLHIEVGSTMDMETPVTWSPAVEYSVGSTYKADAFASGRFLAVRFSSIDNQNWRIRSFDMDVQTQGTY